MSDEQTEIATEAKTKNLKDIDINYESKINEIHAELEGIFKIDEYNLTEENMRTVSRLHYWISTLAKERRLLIKISRKRNYTFSKLYEAYREGKDGKGFITLTKDGIEAYIRKDSEFLYWDSMLQEQQNIVDYINEICWALKQTKMTALKNIQDSKRIEGS